MNKVFEPGAVELADPRGDPNQAIEIQQKVKELLGANPQRRQGLEQEIQERGAWALPGLVNATYVWMNELADEPAQEMIAALMARLAQDNPAAVDLLFRNGVLGTPFPIPQSIARRALERLDWKPGEGDTRRLEQEIKNYSKFDDIQTMLDLYALLLRTGSQRDYSSALNQCKDWARRSLKQSGELLALLTRLFPSQAEQALTDIILSVKEAYKDENMAGALLDPLRPIHPAWLQEGILLRVSLAVLRQMKRHTTVEYLWMYAAKDCREKQPQLWQKIFRDLGERIRKEGTENLYRYWFRAVDEVNETDYIVEQTRASDESWGMSATLQLFFERRHREQAKQALKDLESENPARYARAEEMYETLIEHRKERKEVKRGKRRAVAPTESKD